MSMRRYTIQVVIYPGDERGYVAECLDLAVVTQGKSLDETVQNLREAIQLHLEGENPAEMGGIRWSKKPFINFL